MNKTLYFLLFTLSWGCYADQPSTKTSSYEEKKQETVNYDSIIMTSYRRAFCEQANLVHLFDCNSQDCYQIQLSHDPFKDFVYLTIYSIDSFGYEIYYNRFEPSSSNRESKFLNNKKCIAIPLVNQSTRDTLFFYHCGEKKIQVNKDDNIEYFLNHWVWETPLKRDTCSDIDPEVWSVRGRAKGKSISIIRCAFKDSVYYSNLQKILDVCKVKDYKYIRR
jgi:hypothetical protein